MRGDVSVLGHICEGLEEFQYYADGQCIPVLNDDGTVSGCDDSNDIPLKFCPFCGTKFPLEPPARTEWETIHIAKKLEGVRARRALRQKEAGDA